MYWEQWVKAQLRLYLCRKIDLERMDAEISAVDIAPSVSQFDTQKVKSSRSNGSVVEFYAMKREKTKSWFQQEKLFLLRRCSAVEKALGQLTPFHRDIIEKTFFSLNYTDKTIGQELNISDWSVIIQKRAALRHVYEDLWEQIEDSRQLIH